MRVRALAIVHARAARVIAAASAPIRERPRMPAELGAISEISISPGYNCRENSISPGAQVRRVTNAQGDQNVTAPAHLAKM